ncbi:YggS family pyridoxal phosphate-dependent enzyme [Sphingomicrobium sp. XHP0235]|uniref:YggS family pyridoxal phosphate-dependent enzyme n=1 Tax=Sphingomicrobium aquimarinum TaxID=3133971 RepID=UPI0031FEAD24
MAIRIARGMTALEDVKRRIAKAMTTAGRSDPPVLIAVSKKQGSDAIRPLLEAGHRDFGENRVEEAAEKWPALRADFPDVRLHMVGQLQSKKAGDAMALFDAIHSLDRESLLKALVKERDKGATCPDLFVQVDLQGEEQKGGIAPDALGAFLGEVREKSAPLKGLMCLPPVDLEASPFFALLAELGRRHDVNGLSMGMSGDYEEAVMLGATHVRVGTALFGARS